MSMAAIRVADVDPLTVAFPDVKPGVRPFGSKVLIQIRQPKRMTKGGLIIPDETRDAQHDTTQVGKVIKLGQLAFCNRDTGEPWTEGAWCAPGDYLFLPKYQGARWRVRLPGGEAGEAVEFVLLNDLQIDGGVDDPLIGFAYLGGA